MGITEWDCHEAPHRQAREDGRRRDGHRDPRTDSQLKCCHPRPVYLPRVMHLVNAEDEILACKDGLGESVLAHRSGLVEDARTFVTRRPDGLKIRRHGI